MKFATLVMMVCVCVLGFASVAEGHKGAWRSHSTVATGGPPDAKTFADCERLDNEREGFLKHRCKHKVYWNQKYRELSHVAKSTLRARRGCEGDGRQYKHDIATGSTYHSEYQYDMRTAGLAGFSFDPHAVYYRELDVRTWWYDMRTLSDPWPNCP